MHRNTLTHRVQRIEALWADAGQCVRPPRHGNSPDDLAAECL
ncbi:hypothetical protein Q7C20_11170 [Pseudomonas sp. AMR01]